MKTEKQQNEQLRQTPVSGSFKMTANQKKHFVRIWIGSMLLYSDMGLDEVKDIEENEFEKLDNLKRIQAIKYLKEDKSFASTTEVYHYVIQNYR